MAVGDKWFAEEFGTGSRVSQFQNFMASDKTEIIKDSNDAQFTPVPRVEFIHQFDSIVFDFLYYS